MRAVQIVQQRVIDGLGFMHSARRDALNVTLTALVAGGAATVTALGRARGGGGGHKHAIKAVDRLVGNRHLHDEMVPIWASVASTLLGNHRGTIVLLVDWTQLGADHYKLTATLVISGRSLSVLNMVASKHYLAKPDLHEAFLAQLTQIIQPRPGQRVVIVSDAGFASRWFQQVQAIGWHFIGRIRNRTKIQRSDGQWVSNKVVGAGATNEPEDLGWMSVTKERPIRARIIRVHEPPKGRSRRGRRGRKTNSTEDRKHARSAQEPWVLATSLTTASAGAIVTTYRHRMRIEEYFRDEKNDRWGWCLTKVVAREGSSERLEVLALLAALATLAMTLAGIAAERRGLQRAFQANTVRKRRVLSLFVLGTFVSKDDVHLSATQLARAVGQLRTMIHSTTVLAP